MRKCNFQFLDRKLYLEPVSVDRRALVLAPLHHSGSHRVRVLCRPRGVIKGAFRQSLLSQVRVGNLALEQVLAVGVELRHERTGGGCLHRGSSHASGGWRKATECRECHLDGLCVFEEFNAERQCSRPQKEVLNLLHAIRTIMESSVGLCRD